MPTSPLIKAIDHTRVSVDSMTLEELEDHAEKVLDTLADLNNYNNSLVDVNYPDRSATTILAGGSGE